MAVKHLNTAIYACKDVALCVGYGVATYHTYIQQTCIISSDITMSYL
jgi:hypothetical protein